MTYDVHVDISEFVKSFDYMTAMSNVLANSLSSLGPALGSIFADVQRSNPMRIFEPTESSGLGQRVLARLYAVVEQESGLPPCEELRFAVLDDFVNKRYKLVICWPGDYEIRSVFDQRVLMMADDKVQLSMIEDAVRQMTRQWLAAIK